MKNEQNNIGPLTTGVCKICGKNFSYNLAKNKKERTICPSDECAIQYQRNISKKHTANGYKRPPKIAEPYTLPKYATDCVFEEFMAPETSDEINMKKVKNLDDLMDEFKKRGIPDADYAKWQKARTLAKASPIIIP